MTHEDILAVTKPSEKFTGGNRRLEDTARWSVRILDKLLALGSLDIHDKATVRSVREALALGYQRKEEDIVKHWELRAEGEKRGVQAALDHVTSMIEVARAFGCSLEELDRSLRLRESAGAFYSRLAQKRAGSSRTSEERGT